MVNPQVLVQALQKSRGGTHHLNRFLKERSSLVSHVAYIGSSLEKPKWATAQAVQDPEGLLWTRDGNQFLQITSAQERVPWAEWKTEMADKVLEDLAHKLPAADRKIVLLEDLEFWLGFQNGVVVYQVTGRFAWKGSRYEAGKVGGKHLVLPGDGRQLVRSTLNDRQPPAPTKSLPPPQKKIFLPGA